MDKKRKKIVLELDENSYRELVTRAEREGFSLISDFIIALIKSYIEKKHPVLALPELRSRVKRIVEDEMNKYMEALSSLKNQLAGLYERVERLELAFNDLAKKLEEKPAARPQTAVKKTGMERLREEKVVFESALPQRLRRDRFFNYLKREGAVVVHLNRERIAVDPEYWKTFSRLLFEELHTDDEEEIKRVLGAKGFELFRKLREESAIYYDPNKKRWFLTSKDYFK
ncbi:MAG: CopG family transcriptional regulator [Thermoprotei archaeon]|nr:MAG: CopG family transcriptional regulator [Thermoprotei archaeon]